MLIVHGVQ